MPPTSPNDQHSRRLFVGGASDGQVRIIDLLALASPGENIQRSEAWTGLKISGADLLNTGYNRMFRLTGEGK